MTIQRLPIHVFVLVSLVLSSAAHAEQIYRCGNSYSQAPCAAGKVLNIDDSRDAARKQEVDTATRRDVRLADQLERERLQQEQALVPKHAKSAKPKMVKPKKMAPVSAQDQTTTLTPKRLKGVLHKPKDFTAMIPGSVQPPRNKQKSPKPKLPASK